MEEGYTNKSIKSFEEYVHQIDVKKRLTTSLKNFVCDEDGNELIDDILKFEQLAELLPIYLSTLGISLNTYKLPKHNVSKDRKEIEHYYTDILKQTVYKLYTDDINRFSYTFPNINPINKAVTMKKENNDLAGMQGGAWSENTHQTLHPTNFNFGMANFIVNNIQPKSVLEFGSGIGYLSRHLVDELSLEKSYCIEPNKITGVYDNINGPKLISLDIFKDSHPHVLNHKFDLVLSIEVAEHIPREHHDRLFDFLVAHTNNWIVFSGARIGQGGHGHIAERDEDDWKSEFLKRGMIFQEMLTQNIRLACDKKNINHQQNLMVFKRPDGYEKLDIIEQKAVPHLKNILEIVQRNSDRLQGNLFYVNLQDAINGMPVDSLKEKRRTLVQLMDSRTNILEIGFNAGHSALIMLLTNADAKITIIDIGHEPYMEECFHYLNSLFPERLKLIKGDSTKVIHILKGEKFDLIHYDGGKEKTILQDLKNSVDLVTNDHVLLIDDTQNSELENIVLDLEKENFIDLKKYQKLSKRTDPYKWRHVVGTFNNRYNNSFAKSILQKLKIIR